MPLTAWTRTQVENAPTLDEGALEDLEAQLARDYQHDRSLEVTPDLVAELTELVTAIESVSRERTARHAHQVPEAESGADTQVGGGARSAYAPAPARSSHGMFWLVGLGALAAVFILVTIVALTRTKPGGEVSSPDGAVTASSAPTCTSGEGFTYRAGACLTGSRSAEIEFTSPGAWGYRLEVSGPDASGNDCSKRGIVVAVADEATNKTSLKAMTGGSGSQTFPARAPADKDARWRLSFDTGADCPWTLTFT